MSSIFNSRSNNTPNRPIKKRKSGLTGPDTQRKINFLRLSFGMGICISLIFATNALYDQRYIMAGLEYFLAVSFIVSMLHLQYTKNPIITSYYIVLILGIFFFFLTVKQGINHSPWAMVMPPVTMFLLGSRKGVAGMALYFLLLLVFSFNLFDLDLYRYPTAYIVRYLGAFFTIAVISYFYEKTRYASYEKAIMLLEELSEKNKLLSEVAKRDGLTGLLNHKALHDRLRLAFNEAARYQQCLSLIMLDVDNFKMVNDRWGHPAGDEVLREVSAILKETLRESDVSLRFADGGHRPDTGIEVPGTAARYGGDEFVAILPHCGEADIIAVAERLLSSIRSIKVSTRPEIRVTASIGLSVYDGQDTGLGYQQLIQQADEALYVVKEQGRNSIHMKGLPE